ncbi:hypothetical protein [Nocardioides sp. HB32]
MTTLRTLLAGLLAAFALVAMTPAAALACSCVVGSTEQHLQDADVVFTGTLTEVEPPPRRVIMSSGDPATYHFDVHEVLKGDAPVNARVTSAVSGASCGLENMTVDQEYVVYANGDRELTANLCGGTAPAGPARVERLRQVTGPAHPPASAVAYPAPGDGPPYAWILGAGAGVGLVAAGAAALGLRRRAVG